MKKFGKLRRGALLLCVLCLASACAVPVYAADPVPAKCTTPVITYKYLSKFQVAIVIYYDTANTDTLTVKVNDTEPTVTLSGSPVVLDYYLPQKSGILVTAVASHTAPASPSDPPVPSPSDMASLVINGYAVPNSRLRNNTSSPGVNKFNDVPFDSWYRQDISRLVKAGAITCMTSTTFAPESTMTVAQYLKVLLASMYQDEMITTFYKGSQWYDPYFEFSALSVNEDGFLDVSEADRGISRYEMAVLLARAYKMYVKPNVYQNALRAADPGAVADYDKIPEQYREAVLICYSKKMLMGMDSAGTFYGDGTLTRGQACATVVRLFNAI